MAESRQDTAKRLFFRFFKDYIRPYRASVLVLVALIIGRVGLGLWWPFAGKTMVDKVLATPNPDWTVALSLVMTGFMVLAVDHLLMFLFNRRIFRLHTFVVTVVRARLVRHLLSLSQQFYDVSHAGRLLTTAVGDPSAITFALLGGVINAVANALVVLGGYFILLHMNTGLTLAITCVFPLMIGSYFVMRSRLLRMSETIRESWGILSGMVAEKIGAVRVVRSYAAEDMEAARFRDRAILHGRINTKNAMYNAVYGSINGFSVHLGYVLVFLIGGWQFIEGRTTLGTVVAFYGYFQALWPAVLQICSIPQTVAGTSGSLVKIYGVLDEPLRIRSAPGAPEADGPFRELRMESVSFRYSDKMPWVARNVDLTLRAGERLGVIGPSGSGKSTLMALMLRFYDPVEGRVLLNGRDIREWDLKSVRRMFGVVSQEVVLFSGTVRENVVYSGAETDEGRVWRALEDAEAAGFVREAPQGLETRLGERGLSLSGGQRQRISLARALLGEPQVLVLDNCTSALDATTERRVQERLRSRLSTSSAVIVSHRISSVQECDRVVVLDAGRVIEQGPPGELAEQGGYFEAIWRQQAGPSTPVS